MSDETLDEMTERMLNHQLSQFKAAGNRISRRRKSLHRGIRLGYRRTRQNFCDFGDGFYRRYIMGVLRRSIESEGTGRHRLAPRRVRTFGERVDGANTGTRIRTSRSHGSGEGTLQRDAATFHSTCALARET